MVDFQSPIVASPVTELGSCRLRDESHLGAVADPAGGSWFVETLTEQLARAAAGLGDTLGSRVVAGECAVERPHRVELLRPSLRADLP